jgi:outer membrane protein OmpA-like peptidoglycan-associated protein/opacity protein-like surface antigen
VSFHGGWVGLASIGWGFGNGLRAEIEGDYRQNKLSKADSWAGAGGDEEKYGAMINALYDFWGVSPYVVPYLGVGVGYMDVNEHNVRIYAPGGSPVFRASDDHGSFAYQAILGAAIPLDMITPGLAVTLEYRFMGLAGDRTFHGTGLGFGAFGGAHPASLKLTDDYNHAGLIGVRYAFNAAPPPPPPAPVVAPPAPTPARTYLVFFDWDRADLTARARQIIADAARNSTRVQYTRIEVNGYTDTSGTPQYNLRLSVRRAESVRAELIRDGVPANAIDIHGYGETHLLVPTGPGVREPQNRRVEIIFQ